MRIALINPITQTVDRPENLFSLLGKTPQNRAATDSEVLMVKLGQTMADLGHEVTLFVSDCFRPQTPYQPKGSFNIEYLPTKMKTLFPPAYLPWLPTLYQRLREEKFDCIQATELIQPSTWIAAFAKVPVFVWEEIDQYFSRKLTRTFQKFCHQSIERLLKKKVVVIPRSHSSEYFLKKRGWKKISAVIPTPVDTNIFKPLANLSQDYLLVVSRLAPDRGLSFLMEVMEYIVPQHPAVKLVVVGRGVSQEAFESAIKERGLLQHIEIRTNFFSHTQLNEVYNKSLMTLITTEGGLYPYAASESLACGKIVISSFKRALKDLIKNDQTGYLIDTPKEMSERILSLLKNPAQRYSMEKTAREFVCDYCDLKKVANSFIQIYKDFLREE